MSLYLVSVESKFTSNPMELFQSVKSVENLKSALSLTELNRELGELYPQSFEAQTEFNSKNIKVWGMDR